MPPTTTTAPGVVTNYVGGGIWGPYDIEAGPDGALWFTNYFMNSIGRMGTDGSLSIFPDPSISSPDGIAGGTDAACVVCQHRGQIRSVGSVPTARRRLELRRPADRPSIPASPPASATPCGSPAAPPTRSATSAPTGSSTPSRISASTTRRASPRVPTAPCGSPTSTATRSARHARRPVQVLQRLRRMSFPLQHRRRFRRRAVVHQSRQQFDRAHHDRRDGHQLPRQQRVGPDRHHFRLRRRLVVHELHQQHDRAHHHQRESSSPTATRRSRRPTASRRGLTARSGSRTPAPTRSDGSACDRGGANVRGFPGGRCRALARKVRSDRVRRATASGWGWT